MSDLYKKFSNHFTQYTTPANLGPRDGLNYWREKILLYLIYILNAFVFIAYLPSIILSLYVKLWIVAIVDTAAYCVLIFLFISKSLSVKAKTIFILTLAYPLAVTLLLLVGPFGAGYIWLFVVPILAAIMMDPKTALYSIVINTLTLLIVGLLIQENYTEPSVRACFAFESWLVITANFTFLEIIITLSIVMLIQGLEKSLLNEKNISQSLELQTIELAAAKNEAEKADSMKSEFLAQVSHEIRTPINTILNSTSMLREGCEDLSDEDKNQLHNMIQAGSSRVIRTIDLILNMAEIKTGSYKNINEPTLLVKDILSPLLMEFHFTATQKDLKIIFNTIGPDDYELICDRYSVTQIFANLIDNAIKYTHQGSISIELREDKNFIEAKVTDTGIGISEEYLRIMFEPFTQEETGYSRHFDGNGLGLALVRKYCEMNNAQISVKSKKGEGSTFTVRFAK